MFMKSLRLAVAAVGLLGSVFAAQVSAAPILFNFYVDFTAGPLNNQTFWGNLSVDSAGCPGGICSGQFHPLPTAPNTLLAFNITIAGSPFNLADDGATTVGFTAGQLTFIDYFGVNAAGNTLEIFGNPATQTAAAAFINAAGVTSPGIAAVPEPGTTALLGSALLAALAVGCLRRRDTGLQLRA
jgi:hypothetical protein